MVILKAISILRGHKEDMGLTFSITLCYKCFCIYDWKIFQYSHYTNFGYFYLCICRFAGVLVMLLPLCSLQWWRCQLIPSSFHSARTLRSTKGQPNMRLPFSLKLLMTKVRCRDSLKDPSKRSWCLIFLQRLESLYIVRCSYPFPFPQNFQFHPVYASLLEKSMWESSKIHGCECKNWWEKGFCREYKSICNLIHCPNMRIAI